MREITTAADTAGASYDSYSHPLQLPGCLLTKTSPAACRYAVVANELWNSLSFALRLSNQSRSLSYASITALSHHSSKAAISRRECHPFHRHTDITTLCSFASYQQQSIQYNTADTTDWLARYIRSIATPTMEWDTDYDAPSLVSSRECSWPDPADLAEALMAVPSLSDSLAAAQSNSPARKRKLFGSPGTLSMCSFYLLY